MDITACWSFCASFFNFLKAGIAQYVHHMILVSDWHIQKPSKLITTGVQVVSHHVFHPLTILDPLNPDHMSSLAYLVFNSNRYTLSSNFHPFYCEFSSNHFTIASSVSPELGTLCSAQVIPHHVLQVSSNYNPRSIKPLTLLLTKSSVAFASHKCHCLLWN